MLKSLLISMITLRLYRMLNLHGGIVQPMSEEPKDVLRHVLPPLGLTVLRSESL